MTIPDPIKTPEQPSDPALFAPLTTDENGILRTHLTAGWYKQDAVYPLLSEPWQETYGLLKDLGMAYDQARAAAKKEAELAEPEPGAGL